MWSSCCYPLKPRTRLTHGRRRSKKEQRLKFPHVPPLTGLADENCFGGNVNVHSTASYTRDDLALRRSPFFLFARRIFHSVYLVIKIFIWWDRWNSKFHQSGARLKVLSDHFFWLTYLCPCSRRHRQRDFRLLFVDKSLFFLLLRLCCEEWNLNNVDCKEIR
jgi:hypothetical protein